uniref:Uncharacterized protein n=1 Tax=Arundo donax TaxID=35708 RepID=A0A0A8YF07_ARUDO
MAKIIPFSFLASPKILKEDSNLDQNICF